MQIQKLSEMKAPTLNVLVYGPPGAGKTRFSGTVAKRFKPLILSAESGLLSLQKLRRDADIKEFDYVEIKSFDDIENAYKYLKFDNKNNYQAIIMDSVTEIQKICMEAILKEEGRDKARIDDWGTLNNRMVAMIRAFRDIEMHFIVTALSETDKEEETGIIMTKINLQGKLKENIASYFDEVFYLNSKEVVGPDNKSETKRWLVTSGTTKLVAKDRSGMLKPQERADFISVYKSITNENTEEKQ